MASKKDVTTAQGNALVKMANEIGVTRARFQEWLDREAAAILKAIKPLLTFITSVALDPIDRFTADSIVVDTSDSAKAKIGWISEDFKRIFKGRVEENVPATTLMIHRLEKGSLDKEIRAELDPKRETITPGQFIQVLAKHQSGWFLAYIEDANGKMWAVNAYWNAYCGVWSVRAYSVDSPDRWYAGNQVLSRK